MILKKRKMKLKPYKFNDDFFELLKGTDYEALKKDIEKNGIKTELHVLKDGMVICGNQRLRIINELNISHNKVPIKIISHLKNPQEIKEYVIKDNLLRRHLKPEQQAFLLDELSKIYEVGRGVYGKGRPKLEEDNMTSSKEDVNDKTANETGVSSKTIQRARAYVKAVKKNPEYKKKKITAVLRDVARKKDEDNLKKNPPKPIKGKFATIVIDPPWEYDENIIGRTKPEYALMNIKELEEKDIMKYAQDSCHLYIWTTNAFIWKAIALGKKWGFEYKTLLTWIKPSVGIGTYFRNSTEHICFFIKKGSKSTRDKSVGTWFQAKRGEHSEKPEEFYKIVEKTSFPPYLYIFGRKKRKGWYVYGNLNPKEAQNEKDYKN